MGSSPASWGEATWRMKFCRRFTCRCGSEPAISIRISSPTAWLAAIARSLALGEAGRRAAGLCEDYSKILQAPSGDDPSASHQNNEERRRLHACLEGLGRERREVVLLAYHYGMTREELANRLGQPVATVDTWLRLSLAQLKDSLSQ